MDTPKYPELVASTAEMVTATVARGRSVFADGKLHMPGEVVSMSREDFQRSIELGFVIDPDAEPATEPERQTGELPEGANPGSIGLLNRRIEH